MKWVMQNIPKVILGLLFLSLIPLSQLDAHRPNHSNAKTDNQTKQSPKSDPVLKLIKGFSAHPCSEYEHSNAEKYVKCIKHEDHISQSYMKSAAWWQLLTTIAGLILIWRTLVHSRNAATSAQETVEVAKAQLRAVIRITGCDLVKKTGKSPTIELSYENSGQSTAKDCKLFYEYAFFGAKEDFVSNLTDIKQTYGETPMALPQSDMKQHKIFLDETQPEMQEKLKTQRLYLYGAMSYKTIFNEEAFIRFAFQITGSDSSGAMFIEQMIHS